MASSTNYNCRRCSWRIWPVWIACSRSKLITVMIVHVQPDELGEHSYQPLWQLQHVNDLSFWKMSSTILWLFKIIKLDFKISPLFCALIMTNMDSCFYRRRLNWHLGREGSAFADMKVKMSKHIYCLWLSIFHSRNYITHWDISWHRSASLERWFGIL